MNVHMLRVAALAVLVGGCAATAIPSAMPSALPTATDATVSGPTAATATPRPTPTPVLAAPCPIGSPLEVLEVTESDPECLHGEIVVTGWLDFPPAMGWEGPSVEPAWLYYPPEGVSALWSSRVVEPEHSCPAGGPCGWFFLHLPPTSTITLMREPGHITLRGHFGDPASATCHYLADAEEFGTADDAEAVRQCESHFVVTEIVRTGI